MASYFQDTAKFFELNPASHTVANILQKLSYSGEASILKAPFIVLINKKDNTEVFADSISQVRPTETIWLIVLKEQFTKFVLDNRFGLITELKANNFRTLTNAGKLAAIVATDPSDPKSPRYKLNNSSSNLMLLSYINMAKSVAKKMKQFIFVHVNGVEYAQVRLCMNLHLLNIFSLQTFTTFHGCPTLCWLMAQTKFSTMCLGTMQISFLRAPWWNFWMMLPMEKLR